LEAIARQPTAEAIFFLGDGEEDCDCVSLATKAPLFSVKGNCDWGSSLPEERTVMLGDVTILAVHGHTLGVKYDFSKLWDKLAQCGAALTLFGHTHTPCVESRDGVTIFNPGSLRDGRYGFVDITPAGIFCRPWHL
jgi:putative phosphoesterase